MTRYCMGMTHYGVGMTRWRMGLLLAFWCCGTFAFAHKPSDSYLKISSDDTNLTLQWDISLKDLELLIGLDNNRDGQITWGELKDQRDRVFQQALSQLMVSADGAALRLKAKDMLVARHSDGAYAVLICQADQPSPCRRLTVEYKFLFAMDPTHRGLLLIEHEGSPATYVFSPEQPRIEFSAGESRMLASLVEYIREGVWHIWKGTDHVLFLVSLLIPAVLIREHKTLQPATSFPPVLWTVVKIVSSFTLAHSITLWLAVMKYVMFPSWVVESVIAISIVVTALHNLYPLLPLSGWKMAFLFGLVHGFGFANVLLDLGLSKLTLAISLLGFNLGVELGQLVIVLAFLPLAYALRHTAFYRQTVYYAGSVAIALLASLWTIERLCNVTIVGF